MSDDSSLDAALERAARTHEAALARGQARPLEFTEDAVARRFAQHASGQWIFDHSAGKWFVWSDGTWKQDAVEAATEAVRKFVESDRRGNLDTRGRAAMGRVKFLVAVERISRSDPLLAASADRWNADPWLLGTPAGTVDLRSGSLRAADPCDYISRSTAVTPAAQPCCPTWLKFLGEATGGDNEVVAYLQRWFGYCLTGITTEHALLFVYGPGGNGKSVLLQTIAGILGSYAATAAMETFVASRGERHPTDLAMLDGARLVIATETEQGQSWAEARIKALTGGDPVTARFVRQNFFTYHPRFKLTISGNHKPELQNVDEAAKRRFNVVAFVHRPIQPDRDLVEKLKAEWPSMLRWMIEGCLEWQRIGLSPPQAITQATADYFEEQDLLAQFIDECCDTGPREGDTIRNLFHAWRGFAERQGEAPRNSKWLGTSLERLNFRRAKDCSLFRGRGHTGIRVRPTMIGQHWQDRD
jgi:putative DNA primase/helicase